MIPDQPSPEVRLLQVAYAAFNARDIDAALDTMASDVAWPKAFTGGIARGQQEVRDYWTQQWSEVDPSAQPISLHPETGGRVLAHVHLVVRDLSGVVIADEHVGHLFTIKSGLIQAMEVCPIKVPTQCLVLFPDGFIIGLVVFTLVILNLFVPAIRQLDGDQIFNLLEGSLWITIAFLLVWRTRDKGPFRDLLIGASIAFALFGVSDFIEIITRAWYSPWPLLALKVACSVSLILQLRSYRMRLVNEASRHATI